MGENSWDFLGKKYIQKIRFHVDSRSPSRSTLWYSYRGPVPIAESVSENIALFLQQPLHCSSTIYFPPMWTLSIGFVYILALLLYYTRRYEATVNSKELLQPLSSERDHPTSWAEIFDRRKVENFLAKIHLHAITLDTCDTVLRYEIHYDPFGYFSRSHQFCQGVVITPVPRSVS